MSIQLVYYASGLLGWRRGGEALRVRIVEPSRWSMGRSVKVGVHRGDGVPPYVWHVWLLELAYREAVKFLDDDQYHHMAEQVQELARERDPTHPQAQEVVPIEGFWELRDKGGPLGRLNVRVFFWIDRERSAIVVLGAICKKADGKTPTGDRRRMSRRIRKYRDGDYGYPEVVAYRARLPRQRDGDRGAAS
jgi:hypothetical protein